MKTSEVKFDGLGELIARISKRDTYIACFGTLFHCFHVVFFFDRRYEVHFDEVTLFDTTFNGRRNVFRNLKVTTQLIEAGIGECDQHGRIPFRMTYQTGSRKRKVEVFYRSAATLSLVRKIDGALDSKGILRNFTKEEERALRDGTIDIADLIRRYRKS